jgi:predicted ATPase
MQIIENISFIGYRGFQKRQSISPAKPDGKFGSGLTILIGPNGGGKSTVIETFRKLSNVSNATFTEGKRNKAAGDKVEISLEFNGIRGSLKTIDRGGATTVWKGGVDNKPPKVSFLPSRRFFTPYFGRGMWDRQSYFSNSSGFATRSEPMNSFSYRLFNALENYEKFSEIFTKIYGKRLDWTIDQNDSDQYYLKVEKPGNLHHSSDGMGEGLVSLLFLVDAIFESTVNEILVIDEPELSLHPQLQRRLMIALGNLAKDRQVLYATHSPEMISIDSIVNGAEIYRIVDENEGSTIYRLDTSHRATFSQLEIDLFNPHAFAYESIACLFAEDNLVITEGQEDVVFLNKLIADLGLNYTIPFWGFGAGGASKIKLIASILQSLGFKNISAIFDGDKPAELAQFNSQFPRYHGFMIPADDIRDKVDANGVVIKVGIFDAKKVLKPEYVDLCRKLLSDINNRVN